MPPEINTAPELLERARRGDTGALGTLLESARRPLFNYLYRMTARWEDAEDLLQDVHVRAWQSLDKFRGDSRFETWLYGIATHVCLDHLRKKKRWPVEAQLEGEREAEASEETLAEVSAALSRPDFIFEIREHIAFCFTCVSRSLEPEQQAALMLREVLGFGNEDCAAILRVSEPVFRHRLSAARGHMIATYDGLCQLVKKEGPCWQCKGLREFAPEPNRGADLVSIEIARGVPLTADSLFDARCRISAEADLAEGRSASLHRWFFQGIDDRESQK
jgi:RNA polymerase sigma-70 factor (ECF subfamily)